MYGHLADAERHKVQPNKLQLAVMLERADIILALPRPVPKFICAALTRTLAFIGRTMGLKPTYDEYARPESEEKAE